MVPKTEIRYSWIYNNLFEKDFTMRDLRKLKTDCLEFEKLFKKYINKILKLIEKYHSKMWKNKFIPVYIVTKKGNSFSDPLTVKYFKNPKMMLVITAHEFLHNNITKKKFKNSKELHEYMEPLLNKVIREMPLNLEEELQKLNKKTREKYLV